MYSQHAFVVYPLAIQAIGATAIEVPARDYGARSRGDGRAVRAGTRMVFLANPNNPTGTFAPCGRCARLSSRASRATCSWCSTRRTANTCPTRCARRSPAWLADFPNLVVARTFSKAYGLAGLRVGYALAHPEVAEVMNRVRQPFNVNHLAHGGGLRGARR